VNAYQIAQLHNLDAHAIPALDRMDGYIVLKLDKALPFIGPVIITSTYRPDDAGSMHQFGYAIDFVSQSREPLGHILTKLIQLGFKRIGVMPEKRMFHIDSGVEHKKAQPYIFLEDTAGNDLGPLSAFPPDEVASMIPGYGEEGPEPIPTAHRDMSGSANKWALVAIPWIVFIVWRALS